MSPQSPHSEFYVSRGLLTHSMTSSKPAPARPCPGNKYDTTAKPRFFEVVIWRPGRSASSFAPVTPESEEIERILRNNLCAANAASPTFQFHMCDRCDMTVWPLAAVRTAAKLSAYEYSCFQRRSLEGFKALPNLTQSIEYTPLTNFNNQPAQFSQVEFRSYVHWTMGSTTLLRACSATDPDPDPELIPESKIPYIEVRWNSGISGNAWGFM
ncbi:hypothetical protein EV361DRAFT_1031432 [Lentinula raphanica]|nr:hypothetical protein EV361DRAFT_1031432 [Lentinula raphanica]